MNGESGVFASIYSESKIRIGRYGVNLEVFEDLCISCLNEQSDKIIIIDEIGPMQIRSDSFKVAFEKIMLSSNRIIGIISYDSYPWIDDFKEKHAMELVEVNQRNRDELHLTLR